MIKNWTVGQKVKIDLKNSPEMIIDGGEQIPKTDDYLITCFWFTQDNEYRRAYFRASTLVEI